MKPVGVKEVSLELMDTMPTDPSRSVALEAMTVAQLGEAFAGLEKAQGQYESLSGMCATLSGIVLQEVKKKVGRGNFQSWLKEHFAKSQKTACLYVRLAEQFAKADPRVSFQQLSLALLDGAQSLDGQSLDFSHPLVARVAKWTKGRTFYQLRQEELQQGGNNHPKCPHCEGDLKSATQELCPHCGQPTGQTEPTPEQLKSELTEQTRQWAQDQLGDSHAAKKLFRLLPDHEAAALSAHYRALAREIDDWVKTPERKRDQLAIEEVLA